MTDLTELDKLEKYLKDKGIRYERIDRKPIQDEQGIILHFTERHQICVPKEDLRFKKWDAICQPGSYGCQEGLLEIMGELVNPKTDGDTVAGWLTAEDVIKRIEAKYGR